MKIIKKLKIYDKKNNVYLKDAEMVDGALFGFGVIKAKDYDKDKFGHLLIASINILKVRGIKKVFIGI